MIEITLTKEQYNRLPYKTTTISKGKTYGDIIGLLETHGIKDYQFTRYQETDQLAFPLIIQRKDMDQRFLVKLTVPRLMYPKKKGRYGPTTLTYLENVSWRIFWWHLKSKLEAIEFGISDEVKEFMYHIHNMLPDGTSSDRSIGDILIEHADSLSKLHALEDKTVIEADYRSTVEQEKEEV